MLTELLLSGTQLHASSDKYTKELREQWSSVRETIKEDGMVEKVSKISGKLFKIQNSPQLIPATIAFIIWVIF